MMYFSYKNRKVMTSENKKKGVKNTLNILKTRYDITDENEKTLSNKINDFLEKLN